jgi:release factor glutamine methyltransferase
VSESENNPSEIWTVARVVRWAAEDFKRREFDSPRLDAELLLGHALGVDRLRLILEPERPLDPDELSRYRALIRRRRMGEPVAYLLGFREFYGLSFKVDARVLIPRPDTEALVQAALTRTRQRSMYGKALDLCTGSGCVAIAFAKQRPAWKVTGVDISADALDLARENAVRLSAAHNLRFLEGDLFGAFTASEPFDLIVANPPYIPAPEIAELSVDIRAFEPRLALDGGVDGLAVVRRIVAEAPGYLSPGGVLGVELMYNQAPAVATLFEQAGFVEVERHRDYAGHERVVSGSLASAGSLLAPRPSALPDC